MRGAAMKVGQVLSTIDFTALPEGEREQFKQTLAALRDDVPPLPFKQVEKLLREELGEKPATVFASFEEEAFAAASIGQVHRAVTREGQRVAVKVQYPGVAEAVDTDLRNLTLLLPLVKRLAPGLDVKAIYAELRERIAEELDYELEAQNQRAIARAHRGHPFAHVPEVHTALSSRRVLVTDLIEGQRFEAVKRARRGRARPLRGDRLPLLLRPRPPHGRVCGDPHPGNYLLLDDGRVGFLDFGLMRVLARDYLDAESAIAVAVEERDAAAVHTALADLGYLPDPAAFDPDDLLAQLTAMGAWYMEPGRRRFTPKWVAELIDSTTGPRSPYFGQMRRQTLPPQALLLRRMEGLVLSTLGEVRAAADWNAIAREYYAGGARRDAARRGRVGVLVGPSGRGLNAEAALHHRDRLGRLVHQQVAAAERRRDGAERPAAGERVQAQVAGARGRLHEAPDQALGLLRRVARSSRARSARRSCATSRRVGRLPRSRCSAVTRPGAM